MRPQLFLEKCTLAELVVRKQALIALHGQQHAARLLPLAEDDLHLAAFALAQQALRKGQFTHGSFLEDRLEELIRHYGWAEEVPYTATFAPHFARTIAQLDLLRVADYLLLTCEGYTHQYAAFFQAEVDGYQYLLDVLGSAQQQGQVPATRSLARAQDWLRARLAPAPAAPLAAPPTPELPPRRTVRPAPPVSWADVVLAPHTPAQVEALLLALALLERTPTGQLLASADTGPGHWVGALTALCEARYLRPIRADVVKVVHACYGPVVRERTLQKGVKPGNRVHQVAYQRAQAWLHQHGG